MRGSVIKRGDRYAVVVELERDPITNKRRQKWHSGYQTKKAAERALTELLASRDAGSYIQPTKQTVREFATEWLAAVRPTIRPSTHHSYGRNLRLHVLPRLGPVQLRRVDAGMLNALYAALLADGKLTTARRQRRPIGAQRPLYPYDHSPGVPGCGSLGSHSAESRRRRRPAAGVRRGAAHDDHLDRRTGPGLPRPHRRPPFACRIRPTGNHRHAARGMLGLALV